MSLSLKFSLVVLSAVVCGVVMGVLILSFLPKLSLLPDHPLNKTLGVRKPYVVGFLPYWLVKQADKDYSQYLNDVTYFGLVVNGDGTLQQKVNPREEEPGWTRLKNPEFAAKLAELRKKNVKLSLLVHNASEASISGLISQPAEHAQNLVKDAKPIMLQHGFTDINIDIESFRAASPSAQAQFTQFVKEVRGQLQKEELGTVSIEILPASVVQNHLINPTEIGQVADRVILMGYDYHYRGSAITGPVAPRSAGREVSEFDVEITLQELLKKVPAEKVILAIPLYGYEWETLSEKPFSPVIPGTGKTASGKRVEELLQNCPRCQASYDSISDQPYVIIPGGEASYSAQIFYENQQSVKKKLELAEKYKLGGVAFWALGYEDSQVLEPLKNYKSHTIELQP